MAQNWNRDGSQQKPAAASRGPEKGLTHNAMTQPWHMKKGKERKVPLLHTAGGGGA